MKFDELTPQDIHYMSTVHKNTEIPYDQRIDALRQRFGVAERTVRKWLKKANLSKHTVVESEQVKQGKLKGLDPSKRIKLITWAQNATPVHATMLKNMEVYAKFLDAEIFIIQGRYQNPTSLWSENMENDEWWDDSVVPYMGAVRSTIHPKLDILADVKVVPTAENPLSSLEGLSQGRSCIIGHPRLHLQSLPALEGHDVKLMLTTGAVTLKNYTDTKAGQKGAFNHVYGFVVVELKDDDIHYIRQVSVTHEGTFTDLIYNVDGQVNKVERSAAFVMGDIHVDEVQENIVKETLKYFKKVRPDKLVAHDIANGTSVNHHESKDPILAYQKFLNGKDIVKSEVQGVIDFIKKFKLTDYSLHIISSNHNDWFDRWIKETDWRKNIANSEAYMEYALTMLRGNAPKGIIAYLLEQEFSNIVCVGRNESLLVNGWELGQHGDLGASGSRGSVESYRRLNTKIVVGHIHSVNRKDGALTVGTYTILRPSYNKGPSAWVHSGIVVHDDSKAQHLIFMKDGKFTSLYN